MTTITEPQKLLKARQLKSILNAISDSSLEIKEINRTLPYGKARIEGRIDELIELYESIIRKLVNFLRTTEYGKGLD